MSCRRSQPAMNLYKKVKDSITHNMVESGKFYRRKTQNDSIFLELIRNSLRYQPYGITPSRYDISDLCTALKFGQAFAEFRKFCLEMVILLNTLTNT